MNDSTRPGAVITPPDLGDQQRSRELVTPRSLRWLCLQGLVFLPMASGTEGWAEDPWYLRLVSLALAAWVAYAILRNAVRLWRAPVAEARVLHFASEFAAGAIFLLIASGPLFESEALGRKAMGAAWAVLGVLLIALAVRELGRLRNRRGAAQQ